MKIQFDLPPAAANESQGLAVRYAAAKRAVPRWRWYLIIGLVLLPLLWFAGKTLMELIWVRAPGFVLLDRHVIRTALAGRVTRVEGAGTSVRQGQIIAEMENAELQAELARLETLVAAPAAAERGFAQEAAALAARVVAERAEHHRAMVALMNQGAATQADVAGARADLDQAQAQLLRARAEVAAEARRQRLARLPDGDALGQLERLRARAQALRIVAPSDGTLVQVDVKPGERVTADADIAVVAGPRPPRLEAYVEPARAHYAVIGRRATVRFLDGTGIPARVVAVSHEARRMPAERASPLSVRPQSIVVVLEPDHPLPARYAIHALPMDVRFDLF